MTPEQIKTLIDQKIAGQGTMVDVGGALPTILKEIVDMASAGANVQSDWDETDDTKADFIKNKPEGLIVDCLYDGWDPDYLNEIEGANALSKAIIVRSDIGSGSEIRLYSGFSTFCLLVDDRVTIEQALKAYIADLLSASGVSLESPFFGTIDATGTAFGIILVEVEIDDTVEHGVVYIPGRNLFDI